MSSLTPAIAPELAAVMADVRARLAGACAGWPPEEFEALVVEISRRKLAWTLRDTADGAADVGRAGRR